MIFVYCKKDGTCITKGRIYAASPILSAEGATDYTAVQVKDECGNIQTVERPHAYFDFLSCVFAVVVKNVAQYVKGDVVMLDDSDDNGAMFKLTFGGYLKAEDFEILDESNLSVGMRVLDPISGRWEKIDDFSIEDWKVVVNGYKVAIYNLKFAVANGSVASDPTVRCVSAVGVEEELTVDRLYEIEQIMDVGSKDELYLLVNDQKVKTTYMSSRFSFDMT